MRARLLPALATGAALWVVLVSAAAAALSAVGWWSPDVAWPVAAVLAVVSARVVHGIPEVRMPGAASVALVAVAAGFAVWAGATHSEQVLPRRDAASNLQAAVSLAATHSRVVAVDPESVGGAGVLAIEGVTLASPAFFEVGSDEEPAVQPQFVVGPAVVHAFGWWAGGGAVALVLPAVAMGLALLALGLLVARAVGAWWGVGAAALTGVLFPVLHTARATYSEPLAMLTLAGGLFALTLAVAAGAGPTVSVRAGFVGDRSSQGRVARGVDGQAAGGAASGAAGGAASGAAGGAASGAAGGADGRGVGGAADGAAGRGAGWRSALRGQTARAGLLAGLLVGGTALVRVDALREVVLLLPVVALGRALGARWAAPLLAGLASSVLVAGVAAVGLSSEYLASIAGSLVPLVVLAAVVGGLSWGALLLWRRGRWLPARVVRRLPDVAALAVLGLGLYLASRPLWQVVRQDPTDAGARYVAGMQARQGLAVDGGRTYAEQTVAWLSWYVGPVALAVALLALAALVRRAVTALSAGLAAPAGPPATSGRPAVPAAAPAVLPATSGAPGVAAAGLGAPAVPPGPPGGPAVPASGHRELAPWLPALLVAAGSTLLTLLRPGITPDHPWADRRLLIPLALVVVLVLAGAAWLARQGTRRGGSWVARGLAAGALVALVVPALLASWPHRAGGVERGSFAAVEVVCDALTPGDVVLAVDSRAANEWPQVVRGMCGVPALSTTARLRNDEAALAAAVDDIAAGVGKRGGRLVLLAADSSDALDSLGSAWDLVVDVTVREDEHVLERRPRGTDPLPIAVWLGEAPVTPAGDAGR